jgi:hypothetical protein
MTASGLFCIEIILLVAELNQNSVLMRTQIFNDRSGQGIDLFTAVADSPQLSEIMGVNLRLEHHKMP